MSNQIVISSGAKLRNLNGVITGTTGVLDSVPLGGANGVATLDSSGKVPVSQLPSSVVTYLGTWNAATNTPTLANGTGDAGDMYLCNVAGTVDFGAGPITFAVGDWVLYGSGTWQKSNGQNGTVTSVAVTESGDALTITGSPITTAGTINIGFAGTSAQYVAGNGSLITFPALTGYVPYTGATSDVDLDTFKLNASSLGIKGTAGAGHLGLKHQSATATASASESSLFANVNGDLAWKNDNLHLTTFATYSNTADRVYTFPNSTGTVALNNIDNVFTSAQTFQSSIDLENALNLKFNVSGVGIGSGQLGLYATKASTTSNLTLYDGDTSFYARFAFNNTSNKTYTLPSTSGTLALTSDIPSLSATAPISYSSGVISISQATTSTNGYLSSTDWNNFDTAYLNRIQSVSSPLAFSMGILTIQQSTTATNGYLSSTDWNTFNGKQAALSGTGFVKISGTTISYDNTSYLPLSGGTLTGALNGTTATFSGLTVSGTSDIYPEIKTSAADADALLGFSNTGDGNNGWGIGRRNTGEFWIANYTGNFLSGTRTVPFQIATSGAATFSSSVTANGDLTLNGNRTIYLTNPSTAAGSLVFYNSTSSAIKSGIASYYNVADEGDLEFLAGGSSTKMIIRSSGNVGMGTTSPNIGGGASGSTILTVSATTSGRNGVLELNGTRSGSGDYTGYVRFYNNAAATPLADIFAIRSSSDTTGDLGFATSNTERMRITSGGNVGIGTSSPGQKLSIAGRLNFDTYSTDVDDFGMWATTSGTTLASYAASNIMFRTNNAERMRITSGGKVGIGVSSPSGVLEVNGDIRSIGAGAGLYFQNQSNSNYYAIYGNSTNVYLYNQAVGNIGSFNPTTGIYTPLSDINKREDFEHSTIGLNAILGLKPTLFRMKSDKDDAQKQLGFIAQRIKEFIPQAYVENDEFIGLSDRPIIAALVKAIQELKQEIDELKNK